MFNLIVGIMIVFVILTTRIIDRSGRFTVGFANSGGKFATGVIAISVSLAKCMTTSDVDTRGKFAAGVNNAVLK